MSFLNPVSEPVMRFSSTDADAPQIDYNSRVAGDVKTVLKACLVTGYGATASAGWSITNEVDHVAEFVSPSVAMSDYRLGIDDTSTSSTTWYYQYQDTKTNPDYNAPSKSFSYIDKSHASNGWELLVTGRGIIFVEHLYYTDADDIVNRITCFTQSKSALSSNSGKNMIFFNVGYNAPMGVANSFYSTSKHVHCKIESESSAYMSSATNNMLYTNEYDLDKAVVDLVAPIYISTSGRNLFLGQLPPVLSKVVNNSSDVYGSSDYNLDGRPVLKVCAAYSHPSSAVVTKYCRIFLIKTDYWEY